MVTQLSTVITNYLIKQNIINESKQAVYHYGVLTLIVNMISVIEILILGWLTNTFMLSVIFMVSFAILRSYTGGFHFDHYIPCNISYICLYLISIYLYQEVLHYQGIVLNLICFLGVLTIYILSPIIHINKPLDAEKRNRNRLIAQIMVSNLYVISFASLELSIIKYVIISTALLQIIAKGGKKYVK